MLVTDVGGLAELIPDGRAGYVTPAQAPAIAAALADFYHRNRAAEFAANIPELKKQFSWERMVDTMKQLARQLP